MILETIGTIVGIIAAISAIVGIATSITAKSILRHKNTLEFINDYNNDERVNTGIAVFSSVYNGKKKADYILKDENLNDRNNFLFLMNKLEILASGLEHKIYDKKIIADCFGRDLVRTYKQSKPLIDLIRSEDSKADDEGDIAFEKFEKLAKELTISISTDYKK